MFVLKVSGIVEEDLPNAPAVSLSVTDYINSAKGRAGVERTAAMLLLKRTLEEVGIRNFDIKILPSGKPVLRNSDLHFSISHAGGLCAVVLSDTPVGIDIQDTEAVYKIANRTAFAKRFFSEDEYAAYAEEPTPEQLCRIWTRKEALCKLLGRPLGTSLSGLSSFDYPDIFFETRRAKLEKDFFLTTAKKQ